MLKHAMSRDFILKKQLCMRPVLYPARNEEIYANVSHQTFSMQFSKTKLQQVGHTCMGHTWVTSVFICIFIIIASQLVVVIMLIKYCQCCFTFLVLKVFELYSQLLSCNCNMQDTHWYSFALFVHLLFSIVMHADFLELLYVASPNHFRLIMHDLFQYIQL